MVGRQLSLFEGDDGGGAPSPPLDLAADAELMAQLGPELRFGTSSWTFPGWGGIVYQGKPSARTLAERGLAEYARHPLFRTVGIDRSYYRPLSPDDVAHYAQQLPSGFACVSKVWGRITSAVDPRTRAPNPDFLDADLLEREVLRPLAQQFRGHLGPLVLEFMPLAAPELPSDDEFLSRLDRFLGRLPREFEFAVELRNRELISQGYVDVLSRHAVSHVFNFWERMPWLAEQHAVPGLLRAGGALVTRLLIPPGKRYASRKRSLEPFDELRDPQPRMRAEVIDLARAAMALGKVVYVLANNKAEGSSPLTVRALASEFVARGVGRREHVTEALPIEEHSG